MFRKTLRYVGVVLAVAAALLWLSVSLLDQYKARRQAIIAEERAAELEMRTRASLGELRAAQEQLKYLERAVEQASNLPNTVRRSSELSKVQVRLESLQGDVTDLKKEIGGLQASFEKLNSLLLGDVNRALSVPLLRDDLEGFKAITQHDLESVRADVAKTYDINKWLMGLIAAGLLTTIVNNILQGRRGRDSSRAPFE